MKNNVNIDELICKAAKQAAKETFQEFKNSNFIKKDISYFRRVEILLYNYKKLKIAVKQKDEDIKYIQENGLPEKSGSIVIYQSSGGNITSQDRYLQLIEKYKLEKIETEREIKKIEAAINKVSNEKYFEIIKFKYFQNLKEEDIAIKLNKDISTIYRNKKRLINSLKIILFPESIKEYL